MINNRAVLFLAVAIAIFIYYCFIFFKVSHDGIKLSKSTLNDYLLRQQQDVNDYLWGSYRGNLYFGMRTRTPNALMTGLMWFGVDSFQGEQCTKMRIAVQISNLIMKPFVILAKSVTIQVSGDGRIMMAKHLADRLSKMSVTTANWK